VWAELGQGGDGICLDADGAVWSSVTLDGRPACARIAEGGRVLQRIELDRACFACMLGGEDGRTLFMMAADWRLAESIPDNMRRLTTGPRTGQVLTAPAPAPGAGWP
jgi:sugar lactone lactonase YvrE